MKLPRVTILKYEPNVTERGAHVNRYRLSVENIADMVVITTPYRPDKSDDEQRLREVDLAIEVEKFVKENPA
jgi:hypothetical protein